MEPASTVNELICFALTLGATEAARVAANEIVVDPELADRCRQPRCENYGQSGNCPPHVGGPEAFARLLSGYEQALFFTIDVPSDLLYSSDNRDVFQLLHEIAATIEQAAVDRGLGRARAFAGDSCRRIFCREQPDCAVLTTGGPCRNWQFARPSMSGIGVDVAKLLKLTGLAAGSGFGAAEARQTDMAFVCGLVLLD